jgi:hypothetical protein
VKPTIRGHGLGSSSPDLDVREIEGADDLTKKGSLLVLRLRKGNLGVGPKKGDGKAWESRSGAEIKESVGVADVLGSEEALAEVTADDLFGIPDGG